jgi:two-component system response regulator PilR (NtrC family)
MDTILVVDDDKSLREFLEIFLAKEGYRVVCAPQGKIALELIKTDRPDVVISDVRMPDMNGLELLSAIKKEWPDVPVIMITAFASLDSAVEAMKEGAWDYLTKPFRIEELRKVIEAALQAEHPETTRGTQEEKIYRLDEMVSRNPAMLNIFQTIPRIASSPSSVLITGESGTGKELVAKAIHNTGCRKDKPFVVVNCGGIPENLLESELFGHVKGAFTGASHEKKGLFAMADQGTIFLDEIGELPLLLQAKLLRVTQQKSFIPIGATKPVKVDTRIIAATNRDLEQEVINKNFREDLYYRLNVIQIKIPPLRERPEDIPLLVQYFIEKYSGPNSKLRGVSNYAIEALQNYTFPGNVRELENIIERSIALSTSTLLLPESLSLAKHKAKKQQEQHLPSAPVEIPDEGLDLNEYLDSIEKQILKAALDKSGGNKTEAAKLLKINFRSFRYRISKYGL